MKKSVVAVSVAVLMLLAVRAGAQPVATVHVELDRMTAARDHAAVGSGSWTNPHTWGGTVPCSGRLEIPAGVTVTVATVVPCVYEYVVGQGTVSLECGAHLTVETMVPHVYRQVCTDPQQTAVLTLKASAPIYDHEIDPLELMRGLFGLSPIHIEGAPKKEICALDVAPPRVLPPAGATSVALACDPEGWAVGDAMLVAPTLWGQDEVVTVSAIEGRTISFSPALKFTRQNAPAGGTVHVGNMTRNVRVESYMDDAGNRHRQGHVMLMGGGHVVRNASLRDLGRTVARIGGSAAPVSDPIILPDGTRDPSLMPLCGLTEENVRGRYALHFHNPGPESKPSLVEGVVIRVARNAGFKIGIQNHSAHVLARRNIIHQIDGSGLFTEEGNERGEYTDSLIVHSLGSNSQNPPLPPSDACQSQNYREIWDRRRHDFGHRGACLWLQGNNVLVDGLICAGMDHAGIDHSASGLDDGLRKHNTFVVKVRPDHLRDGYAWVQQTYAGQDFNPALATLDVDLPPAAILNTTCYAIGASPNAVVKDPRGGSRSCVFGEFQLQLYKWPLRPINRIADLFVWNTDRAIDLQYSDRVRLENIRHIRGEMPPGSRQEKTPSFSVSAARQNGRYHEYDGLTLSGTFGAPTFIPAEGSTFRGITINGAPYVPTIEACEDSVDNNDDGQIDEGCIDFPVVTPTKDTTPPIDASTPPVLSTGIYTVRADAAGEVVSATVKVKGETKPRCEGTTPLTCAVTLIEWPDVIVIVLTDASGNPTTTEWTVPR